MDAEFVNAPKTYVIKGQRHPIDQLLSPSPADQTDTRNQNSPDLSTSDYLDIAKQYGSDALNYLKEHPGELAANVALAAIPLVAGLGAYFGTNDNQ